MTLAAITAYTISLWLHITAVVVGFGATFAEAVAFPVAMRTSPYHLPYVHRLGLAINQWLTTPAMVVVLVTGIYQTIDGNWGFGDPWISASFLIVIILGGLMGAYFIPEDRKLAAMAEAEIAAAGTGQVVMSGEYQQRAKREGLLGTVAGVLVVIAVFLMVTKPGA